MLSAEESFVPGTTPSSGGSSADYDLAIIGGGINGVGIARDAAGRGLRVILVEQNDLASGTSSASTKLIHGGLRYLEHFAFKLVHEALAEREVLWGLAPHIVRPMRFVLPQVAGMRSAFVLRLGLFLYDHLGGRKLLPGTKTLDLTHHIVGQPLKRIFRRGYEYSDCWVDDARLVALNALGAAEKGASIRTRTKCVRAEREDVWRLVLNARGRRESVTARVLVNAAGPWVADVAETVLRQDGPFRVRLVKGSHIVVPKLFEHDRAYIFQNKDGRIVFAIPYERDFTLIGTTDEDFKGDLAAIAPSGTEVKYLCESVLGYFRQPVTPEDVVYAYAGVRSLYDDGSGKPEKATRDYHLDLAEGFREAPLLTVYGGKITTYRKLAEAAMKKLDHFFQLGPTWTAHAPLPGGDFPITGVDALVSRTQRNYPFLPEDHALRLVRAYGTRVDRVFGSAKSMADLGKNFGATLTEAEIRYLMRHEWAHDAEDLLWRRSKLGLHMSAGQKETVASFMDSARSLSAAE
jgi:glycerol-3-phosphate dehydrogenase